MQNLIYHTQNSWVLFAAFIVTYAVLVVRKLREQQKNYLNTLGLTFASTSLLFASYLITGAMFFYGLTNPIFIDGTINFESLQTILVIFIYNVLARDLALNVDGQGGITGFMKKLFSIIKK